jgi:toxin ParE1/3/4
VKQRTVILSPEALDDLQLLHQYIAAAAGTRVAAGYLDRLETYCLGFAVAGERGHARADIRPGLRIVGFERRVTIAFAVDDINVTILRLFYGGQDWESALVE